MSARRQQPYSETTARVTASRSRAWEPAPPDPGIRPGGIRDRALRALAARPATSRRSRTPRKPTEGGTA